MNIQQLPGGRWRVRAQSGDRQISLGTYDTEEQAKRVASRVAGKAAADLSSRRHYGLCVLDPATGLAKYLRGVYVLRCLVSGLCKIGYSDSVARRVRGIQFMSPFAMELLFVLDGDRGTEQRLHGRFESVRCHGEWFALSDADVSWMLRQHGLARVPVVLANLERDASGLSLRVVICPFCGAQHEHIAIGDPDEPVVPPCGGSRSARQRGRRYKIEVR